MRIDITNVKGLELANLVKQYTSKAFTIKVVGEKVFLIVEEGDNV